MLPGNNIYKNYKLLRLLLEDGAVLTAFDTETTGITCETDKIIEIGAVKFDIDGVLDTYHTLVDPLSDIPEDVTNVNHITNEMVKGSPPVGKVLPDFLRFIDNSILVAHNANFDLNFMNTELLRNGMKPLKNKTIDTLELARWAYPKLGKYALQFLAKTFSINVENAHRADDDALVCMNLFLRCLKDTDSMQETQ
ncbi:3'-5' exonuclease [Treponema parvum]|uniref:3'-5' exonuclease n=1 Tax=Treponema parvum TaxID=138851 RepID=A0A975F091_9SPIR|nr:3'-5' exonuclease [Treponema parvum]QTQ12081.1 3'-5' exonuclease [Treponema parvum]QTQ13717.1 3'-5' exonuclease [Treponema parvum]